MAKDKNLNFRTNSVFITELKKAAQVLDISVTEFARQAIKKKIEEIKRTNPNLEKRNLVQSNN